METLEYDKELSRVFKETILDSIKVEKFFTFAPLYLHAVENELTLTDMFFVDTKTKQDKLEKHPDQFGFMMCIKTLIMSGVREARFRFRDREGNLTLKTLEFRDLLYPEYQEWYESYIQNN